MRSIVMLLLGVLLFQSAVYAETWEDRAARKTPWSTDFPNDPACWNPDVGWNTTNPWIVGIGGHFLFEDFADCFKACARYDTCYRTGWVDEDIASSPCTSSSATSLRDGLNTEYGFVLGNGKTSKSRCK